jgi:hypothetical protein
VAVSLERRRGPRPAAASLFSPVAKWAWSRGSLSRLAAPRDPRALLPHHDQGVCLPLADGFLFCLFIYLHVHTLFGSFLHPAFLPHPSLLADGFLSQPLSRLPAWRRVGPEREPAAASRDSALVRIRGCPATPPMRHRRLPSPPGAVGGQRGKPIRSTWGGGAEKPPFPPKFSHQLSQLALHPTW